MSGERENYFCILELLFCTLQSVEDKIAKYTGLATTCRLFSCIYPQMTKTSWSKNEWLFKKENKTKRALSYCQAANLKAEKESMYSKLLIWSTINTKSAICKTWQIFLPLLPVWRQARQPHCHRTWDFRAFSRGRCEDCSLALSLRKMSGIFDGDLLLSPEALFASNMPQCCFCFLQTSGEREMIPPGNSSTGLCEVRRHEVPQWEGTRAEHGSPALAQPCPGTALLRLHQQQPWLQPGARPAYAVRCAVWHRPTAFNAYSGKAFLMKWKTKGFLIESRLESWVPRLLFAERTKTYNLLFTSWKTQFAVLRRFLHSAEPNASAALWANWHSRPVPPTFFLNRKNISQVQRPIKHALAWGKQCKEKGVLLKGKLIKIGRNLWPFSQDALKCHEMKKHASKCHVILTLVTMTSLHPTQKMRHF